MNHSHSHEAGKPHSLAMAVTLAMLGTSVGIDVSKVWAESRPGGAPTGTEPTVDRALVRRDDKEAIQQKHDALQQKFDATQQKLRPSSQQKIPAVQQKEIPMLPGGKPIDPTR